MITGIEHAAIASPDPEALAGWYVQTLGFDIHYRDTTAVFVKTANGMMIEIIAADGGRSAATLKTPGLRHLALTVDDFDAELASLRRHGVTFLTEPDIGPKSKVVFFSDPEGNVLHLLQRLAPLA